MSDEEKRQIVHNGWNEWSKYVLSVLKKLDHDNEKKATEITELKIEIAKLQVKSGIWGLIGGLIPVLIALAILFFRSL